MADQQEQLLNANSTLPPPQLLEPDSPPIIMENGEKKSPDALPRVYTSVSEMGLDPGPEGGERRSRASNKPQSTAILPRGRSRSPTGGSSATFCDIPPQRSRSPTPTRIPMMDGGGPGNTSLCPPSITYDEVNTAPNSPTGGPGGLMLQDIRSYGSTSMLQNKAVMVTPSGSLLAVNQSPLELRESTLSVNYPDMGGTVTHCMYAA